MPNDFRIQAIRHATMILTVGGKRILVDPMLSPKEAMEPSPITTNPKRIPLVGLPVPVESLFDVQGVLLTHLHFDHFDPAAEELLPRDLPVLCQPGDAERLTELGFVRVTPVEDSVSWEGLGITRVTGHHGRGEVLAHMGDSSGYVLDSGSEKLFVGGDAVWDETFRDSLDAHTPDTIILYGGEARLTFGTPITMGVEDIRAVCDHLPGARVVVVHMEALNHCGLTREELVRELGDRVVVPADGETV